MSSPRESVGEEEVIEELSKMLRPFVDCEMYSVVDRLANATSKEAVESALYEALRASRAALGDKLCEKEIEERESGETKRIRVRSYVPEEVFVNALLEELDRDLIRGLELVRKIVIRALAFPARR